LRDYLVGIAAALDPLPIDQPYQSLRSDLDLLTEDALKLQEDVDSVLDAFHSPPIAEDGATHGQRSFRERRAEAIL
jgi:hypothetical protein